LPFKALMGLSLPAEHTKVQAGAMGRTYFVANYFASGIST